ncbi:hypothetical protein [Butyrivibrio sp. WCD2001]|uniref:hypothetical protein n=1 Tax=Butyrivibrio sp. WCD2001 TaxID=1280681 RepID=UPI000410436C|nr:hypothetical protein [Butyrivibrio sp. WCD2001]
MANLVNLQRISLKNHPEIKENLIQKFIFEHPESLGLGELTPIQREKIQPLGGRLDILMGNVDNDARYEIEIQLGATDPSHIIRTIEYWDTEKKRYPQYDHCAVIVAEEITGRFMNVISLFNGNIPLIALQLSAYKVGDDISLAFTKVMDRVTLGTDEEDEYEVTDRNYWENRSTKKIMKDVDDIFNALEKYTSGYELKYNKFYVGLAKNGVAKNFISFKPKKSFLHLFFKTNENPELSAKIEDAGLDVTYESRWKQYRVKLSGFSDYKKHEALIQECVQVAMDYFNISEI